MNIINYINNLSNKKLPSEFDIKLILKNIIEEKKPEWFYSKDILKQFSLAYYLKKNKDIKKLTNEEKIIILLNVILSSAKFKIKPLEKHYNNVETIMYSIILNLKKNNQIKIENEDEELYKILEREKKLKKLYLLLMKNKYASELISRLIYDEFDNEEKVVRKIIFDWIEQKKIPISTIKYFIDIMKDVKGNTNYFYKELNKNIPRIAIQKELLKYLSKKKKGNNLSPSKEV
ncbi:MAG: hypothetical protein NTU73_04450 [Ignavibacteriae bacterium]|nr:hypothetical protein [Ignavibacteriota bacterium]